MCYARNIYWLNISVFGLTLGMIKHRRTLNRKSELNKVSVMFAGIVLVAVMCSMVRADDIEEYPLGKWPVLAEYEQSPCLDVDDDRLDFLPFAREDGKTIRSKFTLASFGGRFYVNPKIHKGWASLTLSIDSAVNRVEKSGLSCFQFVDVGVKAWPNKYQKLYVVIDKVVRYEFDIEKI